jgi:hypothetical protein
MLKIITAPDFLNQQYVHRYDLVATFRRKTKRTYAVKTFKSFQIHSSKLGVLNDITCF